jgi:hypothetical protein
VAPGTNIFIGRYAANEDFRVPLVPYFLSVGSLLAALLFYANSMIVPAPLPFSVTQTSGLPTPYKPPIAVAAEVPKSPVVVAKVEPPAVSAKKTKVARKQKSVHTAHRASPQQRYANYYAEREFGGMW